MGPIRWTTCRPDGIKERHWWCRGVERIWFGGHLEHPDGSVTDVYSGTFRPRLVPLTARE